MRSKERLEKEKHWARLKSKADRFGNKIETGIKESVIALWALGFKTSASCQGHLDHGRLAPWIDIGEKIPKRSLENVSIKEKILLRMKKFLMTDHTKSAAVKRWNDAT